MPVMRRLVSLMLTATLLVSGCASGKKTEDSPLSSGINASHTLSRSETEEVEIGRQIHMQIVSQFYPYTEPRVVEYLKTVGEKLAVQAGRKLPYRFTLLYSDQIYATSAPGGYVYLTTGMLYFIQNEAELAAVLSHEIGELQYQDPKLSQSRKVLDSVTRAGGAVAPAFGGIGMLAMLGLIGVNMVADKTAGGPEQKILKADKAALHYMLDSGYDPQGLVDLLYRFLSAENEVIPYFFDYAKSRPITEERFRALQKEFARLPLQGKDLSVKRDEYKEMMTGVAEIYQH